MEELELVIEDTKERMTAPLQRLETELSKLRAGKASPVMLDSVKVDYYGTMTPLNQVANVNTPDARTLVVQPWEKKMIDPIEKAIMAANLGLTPINDGSLIRISIPVLTEERRKDICKQVRAEAENTKVVIRNIRRDMMDALKKQKKDGELTEDDQKNLEEKLQKMTDDFIKQIDKRIEVKTKEVMSV